MRKLTKQIPHIHLFDGYQSEPFWKDSTDSTFYDYEIDRQVRVPIRSIEQVKKELGIN